MAKILITGGAGFIGSNLAHALLQRGDEVVILDDLSSGREINLRGIERDVRFVRGDIRDTAAVLDAMAGCEAVLHQAALPSVSRSVQNPRASHDVNVNGTFEILEAARALGVRRVVYAASSSAYGETAVLPKVESMAPMPLSPYGAAKLFGEYYLKVWHHVYGLETVALRYFNVFGPRQAPNSAYAAVIPKFITTMAAGEAPVINGDGMQSRDFCYIDNVVEANLKALTAPAAPGNLYNIALGGRYTLLDLVAGINAILGTSLQPRFVEPRPGDIRHSQADTEAARRDLGYVGAVDFHEGLRRAAAWYLANPEG